MKGCYIMTDSDKFNSDFDSFLQNMRASANENANANDSASADDAGHGAPQGSSDETTVADEDAFSFDASVLGEGEQVEQGEKAVYAEPVKPRKKKRALKAVIAIVVVIALLVGGGYFLLDALFDRFNYVPLESQTGNSVNGENANIIEGDEPTGDPSLELSEDEYGSLIELLDANARESGVVMSDENVWNVLLIGADEILSETVGRSDSMILVSVSHYTDTIVLTSFMRDSYLKIPGYGYNRINAALSYGGVSMLADTIESNFGIHVDNYAMVDFDLFIDIIDAMGGLYLTPTDSETDYINQIMRQLGRYDCVIETPNEPTLFNGFQALYYARIRYIGRSDFDRTERQRKILLSAKDRLLTMELTDIVDLIKEFMPRITTDIDSRTCISLLFSAFKMLSGYDIQQHRIPMDNTFRDATVSGMQVLSITDFETNVDMWMNLVYGDGDPVSAEDAATSAEANGSESDDSQSIG